MANYDHFFRSDDAEDDEDADYEAQFEEENSDRVKKIKEWYDDGLTDRYWGDDDRYVGMRLEDADLHAAAKQGDLAKVRQFLKAGVDPNARACGFLEVLRNHGVSDKDIFYGDFSYDYLFDKYYNDVSVHAPTGKATFGSYYEPDRGVTPLMVTESPAVARRLIKAGADVNAFDGSGNCVLDHAVDNSMSVVKVLLDNGANTLNYCWRMRLEGNEIKYDDCDLFVRSYEPNSGARSCGAYRINAKGVVSLARSAKTQKRERSK